MVRYMADETDGQVVRTHVVKAMWDDTKARVENLGVSNITSLTVSYIYMFYHNFVLILPVIKYNYYFS